MKEKKQIVFNIDQNYVFPLIVAIDSIHEYVNKDEYEIIILSVGLTNKAKKILTSIFDIEIKIVEIDHLVPEDLPMTLFYTKTVYAKLFIEKAYDFNKKFVYLDPDILVKSNLDYLFNFDLEEYALAAVQSVITPYASNWYGVPYWRELNIHPLTPYFNSGVMVIDFDKWKSYNIPEKTILHCNKWNDKVILADQDVLNTVFAGNFAKLPMKWNQETPLRLKEGGHLGYLIDTVENVKDAEENPAIIHFTGAYNGKSKPWLQLGIEPFENEWNARKARLKNKIIQLLNQ